MEEVINIGSFELDTSRLEANLDKLQNAYLELKREGSTYTALLKEQQKAANDLTKEQLKLAASGQEESDVFKENNKLLDELNASMAQNAKNQLNVANNISRVRTELNNTNKQLQAYMDSEGKQTTLMQAGNIALERQIKNKNDAKAANIELNRVSNQLNPAIKQENDLLKLVNAQIDKNTKFIKENTSEVGQQKMNVGGYKDAIKEAYSELGLFNGQLGNAGQALSKLTPMWASLKMEFSDAFNLLRGGTVATEGLTKAQVASATATNVVSGALKFLRVALISTGIGALVVGLGSLIAFLTTTQEGIAKLSTVLEPLKAIFTALQGVLANVGRGLVEAFSNPKKALIDLANLIKDNLINRFKALGVVIEGIRNLDFKKVADGFLQAGTGVEGLTDKITNAAKASGAFLDNAIKKGQEIDKINKEINKQQLDYNRNQIAIGDLLDEQQLIVKNTSLSFAERAKAANEIIAITAKNSEQEQQIIQLQLRKLKIQKELKGVQNLTNDDRQEEIDLLVKLDEAEDRALNARLENSRVLAGLEKERREAAKKAADEAKKREQERVDAAIKAMQTELDFYLQSQGVRKKDMTEQLEIDKETMRQSLAINKAEFDAKKKTRREFETENLRIQNEFLAKQVEATVANAELEFEMLVLNNERKIEQGQLLNDTLYQQEIDRINRLTEEAQAVETLRYQQGLSTLQEYQLAIAQLDQADYEAKQAVELEREEAQKEKDAVDLANRVTADGEAFQYNLELQLQQFDQQYALEKQKAVEAGADMIAFEQAQAEKKKQIERTVQGNRLDLASSTFANLAAIAGKESAAGKALAVAQATIDTYKGATSAYSSLSGIPIVGPVLGAIAAAAAVAAGIANVKKIVSTKEPKIGAAPPRPSYADGVIGLSGLGSGRSDNIQANLSAGESVITSRGTSMFPNTLSAINAASAGAQLDGQLASAIAQNQIQDRVDSSQMASVIAEAVAIGAREGTARGAERGLTNLSDNRQIIQYAKF